MSEAPSPREKDVRETLASHHREFLGFLERRVGREAAEDILQEAFARGLERIESLRDDEAATAWFYRALRNATIDYHRRRQSKDRALALLAGEMETATAPVPAIHDEVCRCVSRLAETLKPEYADALKRVELDEVSVADFAEERGISKGNAAVRVHRAREALRRQVAAACGACATHGCRSCACDMTALET